jgi:peptide/nickel transport system substrate-binding protein
LFSLERIRQPASDMSFTVASVERINKIDDLTIEIITRGPNPTLLQDLTGFFIMSKSWVERNNAMQVTRACRRLDLPQPQCQRHRSLPSGRAPNRRAHGDRAESRPIGEGPPTHNITRATLRPVANAATRVAALLSGEFDVAYPIPFQDIQRVRPGRRIRASCRDRRGARSISPSTRSATSRSICREPGAIR